MKTPKEKEKAIELCNKFLRTYKVSLYPPFNLASQEAKQCALIAVDEVLSTLYHYHYDSASGAYEFWEEVKEEIEKL